MDEVAAAFGPHQVVMRLDTSVAETDAERAALRIPLAGIVGIEQILPRLTVLHMKGAQEVVQLTPGHVQLLGNLRGGEARHGVEHLVHIVGLGLQAGDFVGTALQGGLHHEDATCQHLFVGLVGTGDEVASLSADAWQHLAGDPMLEAAGRGQLRREDEGIEAGLVDERGGLGSALGIDGVAFCYIIGFYMFAKGITAVIVPQRVAHVLGTEHRLALFVTDGADGTKFLILVNFNFVHDYLLFKG